MESELRPAEVGIVIQLSAIESHNSIGLREQYQALLIRLYEKICHASPKVSKEMVVRPAEKRMDKIAVPTELSPTVLFYCEHGLLHVPVSS